MKPKRIQLRRTKGWRLPPNTVVVSRPSKWGNPFVAGPREQRAHDYKVALLWELIARSTRELTEDRHMRGVASDLAELRGKNLACWCPIGEPCHADVLLELANGVTARPNDPSSATRPTGGAS